MSDVGEMKRAPAEGACAWDGREWMGVCVCVRMLLRGGGVCVAVVACARARVARTSRERGLA